MLNSLFKSLYTSLSLLLSILIYFKVDKVYEITDKISLKIKVDRKWQPLLVISCCILLMLILGLIGTSIINIPNNLYSILSGLIMGVGVAFADKLLHKNKNT